MQLRFGTDLSADEYVRRKAWRFAKLDKCPLHPDGGCEFYRHGLYSRKFPAGAKIPRWYCLIGRTTFSLLPDCLSSRLPGRLIEVEDIVAKVEESPSQETAVDGYRIEITLPCLLRWVRRRVSGVQEALTMLIDLLPDHFSGCLPTILSFRGALGVEYVLPELRDLAGDHLSILPPPVGFGPRSERKKTEKFHFQHKTGRDPP
ncbi:MAG: hypothetical protein GY850_00925 [bacterium]|nr:hypothetical protein [bacterium]